MSIKYKILKFFRFLKQSEAEFKRIFMLLASFFTPVKKNRIVFCNFMNGYTCNLKYIAQELIQRGNAEIYWINGCKTASIEEFPAQIRVIDFSNKKEALKIASSAKILITNSCLTRLFMAGFVKKRNQVYINTWHGSLRIKKVNFSRGFYGYDAQWLKFNLKDSAAVDYAISNSDFETEIYRNQRLFKKNILLFGHARNDIFFKKDKPYKSLVCKTFGLPETTKILLYAPSVREDIRTNCYGLNYLRVIEALERENGGKYAFLVRFHPIMAEFAKELVPKSPKIIDVTKYPDIQELLCAADIMVTDYSSCIFDFMLSRKPAFFYAEDIEKYNQERGFYFPMSETPFPIAQNTDELVKNLLEFNENKYLEEIDAFLKGKGAFEDGNASKRAADFIERLLG